MTENKSFVFYGTVWDAAQKLPPDVRLEFYEAVINYGLNGEEYDGDNYVITALMQQVQFGIDKATERWNKSKGDGAKGGRPKKFDTDEIVALYNDGNTQKQIAELLGCNIKTVQRAIKEYREDIIGQNET